MSEAAAAERRSPFDGVPASEVVRDVVAAVALLVALPLPWDVVRRGSDLLWVVLTTVLALVVVAAPYARRAGVLTGGWLRLTEPSVRRLALAPYALVALLYLVLDVVQRAADVGGIGPGLALGLAGVALAAALPGTRPVVVAAVVVGAGAVATPVVGLVDGASWPGTVGSVLGAAFVIGVLWLTVRRFLAGDDAAGAVLVALGIASALELTMLGGARQHLWLESVHGGRYGLLLLPVVAAVALPEVLARFRRHEGEPEDDAAARWVRVAVQAFELMALTAVFVGLVALVQLVGGATAGNVVQLVLRLVVGVLVTLVAILARRALLRDARAAHATAVGAACVVVVLGVVILVARAGVGTASRVEELLLALALPALVLAALLVPRSVRSLVGAAPTSASSMSSAPFGSSASATSASAASASTGSGAAVAAEPVPVDTAGYAVVAEARPAEQPWSEPVARQERSDADQPPADATSVIEPVVEPVVAPRAEPGPVTGSQPAAGGGAASRWRGTWAGGTDATQQLAPVTDAGPQQGRATEPVQTARPVQPVQPAEATQMLPPVVDMPASGWTAGQALDPATPLADLAVIVQEAPHLRPHVAANPSTYPALLDWLGALGDPAVDAALRSRR